MRTFLKTKYHNLVADSRFSEIFIGSAWALSARVLATALGLATSIVIARFYGAEVMGIVSVINSFLMLVAIFTVLGTDVSILRLIPEHLAKYSPTSAFKVYRKTQTFVAGISLVVSVILFLGSGFIADTVFSKPHLRSYFAFASLFVLFQSIASLNTQAVRGVRLVRVFAFMHLLPSFSNFSLLILLTVFFFHSDNPVYVLFASFAITALTGAIIMERVFKKKSKPNDALCPMPMRDILTISLPMFMTATMTFIIGQTGVIMLGIYRPEAEVGYYSVSVKLATLTTFILQAVFSMAGPRFSELYHLNRMDELFHVAQKSAKLIFWITTPALFLLILLGKPVITFLYGAEFSIAYWAMVILSLGQFVNSISGATGLFMNMTGNQNVFRNIVLIAALINLVLNILLTPTYGLYGAAIAGMISMMTWNIATLFFIKAKFGKTTGYFPLLAWLKA